MRGAHGEMRLWRRDRISAELSVDANSVVDARLLDVARVRVLQHHHLTCAEQPPTPASEPGHRVPTTDPVCDQVFLKRFPIQLNAVRVISFLHGSLVLVFPSFADGPYVTSSRRYVT